MLEILYNLQHENYKDISPITKIHSKMHSIVCWNPPIIFIVISNYKSYVVKFIVFLTFSYLNYYKFYNKFWENAKVIINFTTNWYCNGCDQWHEVYKMLEIL